MNTIKYYIIIYLLFALFPFAIMADYLSSPGSSENGMVLEFGVSPETSYNRTVPDSWHIQPDDIVYDERADRSRKRLETRFAASVVVVNEKGEVLFAKRNPKLAMYGRCLPLTLMRRMMPD